MSTNFDKFGQERKLVTAKAQMQKVSQEKAFELFFSDIAAYDTYDYEEEDEYGKTAHSVTHVNPEETTLTFGPAEVRRGIALNKKHLSRKVRRGADVEFAPKRNGYRKICRTVDMVDFT